jgi:hypothetical protein
MTKRQVLDLYFGDARCKLVDLAAFLDRLDRAEGPGDHRIEGMRHALTALDSGEADRARQVLLRLSDPTTDPIPAAGTKGATGAWPGLGGNLK